MYISVHVHQSNVIITVSSLLDHHVLVLILFHLLLLVQSIQSLLAVLHKLHQLPAHVVRLVDPVIPCTVLAETEKSENNLDQWRTMRDLLVHGVYGHAVDADEGVSNEIREENGYGHLRPEMLNLLVGLKWVSRYTTRI